MNNLKLKKYAQSSILILLFAFIIANNSNAQVLHLSLVNKKTNQWISFVSSSRQFDNFSLVSKKGDVCEVKTLTVPYIREKEFIDSLKRNGFTKNLKYVDAKNIYSLEIELISCEYDNNKNSQDSIFKFIYDIKLTNKKTNETVIKREFGERKNKEKILITFKEKKYRIEINEIKATSIIEVSIYLGYLFDNTSVFAPIFTYYF